MSPDTVCNRQYTAGLARGALTGQRPGQQRSLGPTPAPLARGVKVITSLPGSEVPGLEIYASLSCEGKNDASPTRPEKKRRTASLAGQESTKR
ncbi:hypothetical protein NDU88_003292 [Pleurodeles waltl]|uniref:Uncharacterized protein n=1 Tax=Pleurodeles waltl TaxID=8319 RepID=A0AAV7VCX9_PLEWA|nr:hypothetical protein NDU88_003292 [Pleurodeles waltl]